MNVTYIAIGLLAFSVIGITALLVYLRLLKNKYKKNSALFAKENLVVKSKSSYKDIFDRLYQIVYMTFVKMPILKYYTKKTRLKLEMTNEYTEYEIRKRSGKYMLVAVIFIFVSLFVLLNLVYTLAFKYTGYFELIINPLYFLLNLISKFISC